MAQSRISLPEIDQVNITVIVDNSIDLLMASTDVAKRLPLATFGPDPFDRPLPVAEHGFSVLIDVRQGERHATALFDTGISRTGLMYNLDAMQLNVSDIRAIILSHGHPDHVMGLPGVIDRLGTRRLPVVLHPDAYLERKLVLPTGEEIRLPAPKLTDLRQESIEVIEDVGPSLLLDDMVLVSGEVSRTTEFERGFPIHYAKRNDTWTPDPFIMDDQCAVLNLHGKGLIIVTGCGHAGIINIIRHAQHLTGVHTVHAVVGGFHLTGGFFESTIPATVAALQEIGPRYLMPGHCTGWSALHQIAYTMPQAYVPSSVGTTLHLSR